MKRRSARPRAAVLLALSAAACASTASLSRPGGRAAAGEVGGAAGAPTVEAVPAEVGEQTAAVNLAEPSVRQQELEPLPPPRLTARFFTSPSELRDELPVHEIAPRLYFGVEAEAQSSYEKQGGSTSTDTIFDSVTGALRWVPMYGLVGSFEGSYDPADGFSSEELVMTLGAVPTEPWYVTVGHTDLPFGEFNSHFREDPSTQVLGEIQGNQIATGYETDFVEFTVAANEGQSDNEAYSWIGNFTFSPLQDLDIGTYWTSDLSESFELRQLAKDLRSELGGPASGTSPVEGAGLFLSLQKRSYSLDFESIFALQSFEAGVLAEERQQPWAANLEATVRPQNMWELGIRLERSQELPDAPSFQYGLESTYSFDEHTAISLEFLHATFSDDVDRNLVLLGLLARW